MKIEEPYHFSPQAGYFYDLVEDIEENKNSLSIRDVLAKLYAFIEKHGYSKQDIEETKETLRNVDPSIFPENLFKKQ